MISFNASVDSLSGTETLTKSTPALTALLICLLVDSMSVVNVFVIVCTDMGLFPPTKTLPTFITRVFLLFIF